MKSNPNCILTSHNVSAQQLKKLKSEVLNCDCLVKLDKQNRITKIKFWLMEWVYGDNPVFVYCHNKQSSELQVLVMMSATILH